LAWTQQFEFFQPDLNAKVVDPFGNVAVFGKQGHLPVTTLVDRVDRLGPGRFLRVVDLTQVQQRLLHVLAAANPTVLHHAVIAMILPILVPVGHSQEHDAYRIGCSGIPRKGVGLHHKPFQQPKHLKCSKTWLYYP